MQQECKGVALLLNKQRAGAGTGEQNFVAEPSVILRSEAPTFGEIHPMRQGTIGHRLMTSLCADY